MTPEDQQHAIALAMGYTFTDHVIGMDIKFRMWRTPTNGGMERKGPPEYTKDLNACHEMEQSISGAQLQFTYAAHLLQLNGQGELREEGDLNVDHCWIAARSTASQRAEAFLRTLKLWQS